MVEFSSYLGISFMRTINNKSQRNDRGKCLGWPVTSYGAGNTDSLFLGTEYCLESIILIKAAYKIISSIKIYKFLIVTFHYCNNFIQILQFLALN